MKMKRIGCGFLIAHGDHETAKRVVEEALKPENVVEYRMVDEGVEYAWFVETDDQAFDTYERAYVALQAAKIETIASSEGL